MREQREIMSRLSLEKWTINPEPTPREKRDRTKSEPRGNHEKLTKEEAKKKAVEKRSKTDTFRTIYRHFSDTPPAATAGKIKHRPGKGRNYTPGGVIA